MRATSAAGMPGDESIPRASIVSVTHPGETALPRTPRPISIAVRRDQVLALTLTRFARRRLEYLDLASRNLAASRSRTPTGAGGTGRPTGRGTHETGTSPDEVRDT